MPYCAKGAKFGRIDLVWNTETRSIDKTKTRFQAGINLWLQQCDWFAEGFCEAGSRSAKLRVAERRNIDA